MPAVASVLNWLRAGYPEGIPQQDYIPLLALLRRRLTDDEVVSVAATLVEEGDASSLPSAISSITREPPRDEDLARVRAVLARGGWPLSGLE